MKISFTFVDDQGREFRGTAVLAPVAGSARRNQSARTGGSTGNLAFGSNLRAFVKRYARHKNGAQQFTLLLAFLAKGDLAAEVPVRSIAAAWKKAAGLLGGQYQSMYGTQARENDWAESPKRGVCKLSNDWRDCVATEVESA